MTLEKLNGPEIGFHHSRATLKLTIKPDGSKIVFWENCQSGEPLPNIDMPAPASGGQLIIPPKKETYGADVGVGIGVADGDGVGV